MTLGPLIIIPALILSIFSIISFPNWIGFGIGVLIIITAVVLSIMIDIPKPNPQVRTDSIE